MLASSESLVAEMNRLHTYAADVLERGKHAGDDRLVLLALKESRLNVETLLKLGPLSDVEARLAALEAKGAAHEAIDGRGEAS